jgi:triosephosphate isomerase (TIM)
MTAPLVVANWKMNGSEALLRDVAEALVDRRGSVDVVLAVPSIHMSLARALLQDGVGWASQDVHWLESGAYTGELSAEMIAQMGASHSIVGHSERREHFAESDEIVAKKANACLRAGLSPIVCVGESLEARQAERTEAVVCGQLEIVLAAIPSGTEGLIIAYEPIWAIGTGAEATPEMAQAVHAALKGTAQKRGIRLDKVLYGGSVKEDNVAALMSMPDIDGVLVGGASLSARGFSALCTNAAVTEN